MKRNNRAWIAALWCSAALAQVARAEEEFLLEGVVVEAPFDVRLELPQESAVQIMIERMNLRAETLRTAELQIANRNPLTVVLDLTRFFPIPITGSSRPIDTFFLENNMRPDLNPRHEDPLGLGAR